MSASLRYFTGTGGPILITSSAIVSAIIRPGHAAPEPFYRSDAGTLFEGDCTEILPALADDLADTVFADPPFNLGKIYGKRSDDLKQEAEYVE